jgi:hypothetical protein
LRGGYVGLWKNLPHLQGEEQRHRLHLVDPGCPRGTPWPLALCIA